MARAFGPQLACGFSGNLASLSDRDFGLAPGTTVKSACILIERTHKTESRSKICKMYIKLQEIINLS